MNLYYQPNVDPFILNLQVLIKKKIMETSDFIFYPMNVILIIYVKVFQLDVETSKYEDNGNRSKTYLK